MDASTGSRQNLKFMKSTFVTGVAFCVILGSLVNATQAADVRQPRIVNLYNFVRNSDYRLPNSEEVLYQATRHQIDLIEPTRLPATWALQYDALMNPRYQKLFKEQLGKQDEIAAWWEIPRPLAEKAGLKWRGQHDWDSTANVGFSPGYTPDERRKFVHPNAARGPHEKNSVASPVCHRCKDYSE